MKIEWLHHQDIRTFKEVYEQFPLPWEVKEDGYIVAANGRSVVETDSGFYAPGVVAARLIVQAVNAYSDKRKNK